MPRGYTCALPSRSSRLWCNDHARHLPLEETEEQPERGHQDQQARSCADQDCKLNLWCSRCSGERDRWEDQVGIRSDTPADQDRRRLTDRGYGSKTMLAYIKRLMRSPAGRRATILLLTAAVAAATAHPKSWYESIFTIYQQLRHHLSPHRKIQQGVCNRPAPSDVTMTWNHSIIDIDMDGRGGRARI